MFGEANVRVKDRTKIFVQGTRPPWPCQHQRRSLSKSPMQPTNWLQWKICCYSFVETYCGYFLLLRLWFNIFVTVHSLGGSLTSKHPHDAFLRLGRGFRISVCDGFLLLWLHRRCSIDVSRQLQLHRRHGHCAGAADGAVPTVGPRQGSHSMLIKCKL